jgi:hypothetical protein
MSLPEIKLPKRCNYIACFLTLECNLQCDYCINYHGGGVQLQRAVIPGEKWVTMLNRIKCPSDLPVTLQGGEPSLHPDFIWIINHIKESLHIDILTNLTFDVDSFIRVIDPHRLRRVAPYPAIRVSYHPGYMDLDELIKKTLKMQEAGFYIGIFSILHPRCKKEVFDAQKKCRAAGIDFRTKEFLGECEGRLFGTYFYPGAVGAGTRSACSCRTSECIIGPDGNLYRCHHDLYKNFPPIGNLMDSSCEIKDIFMICSQFGDCNPCDIKSKTDRFQVAGHTSVEILHLNKKR